LASDGDGEPEEVSHLCKVTQLGSSGVSILALVGLIPKLAFFPTLLQLQRVKQRGILSQWRLNYRSLPV
jgi:hypothetical protein